MILENDLVPDRSEIVLSLLTLFARLPRLFNDVTKVICRVSDSELKLSIIDQLTVRALSLRSDLNKWRSSHSKILDTASDASQETVQFEKLCRLLGIFSSCSIMVTRLITAIDHSHLKEIEEESQSFADSILQLQKRFECLVDKTSMILFLAQKALVAEATKATYQEWKEGREARVNDLGNVFFIIGRREFRRWCLLFGRKTD